MKNLNLFLISLIILTFCKSKVIYKCADEIKLDTCFAKYEEETGTETIYTYFVKECSQNKKCIEVNGFRQCLKVKDKREVDESCEHNVDCITELCSDGKCKGNTKCSRDEDCGKNEYCSDTNCVAMIKIGNECNRYYESETSDCEFGAMCGKTGEDNTSKCTKMYSLEDGVKSTNKYLCKNGQTNGGKCVSSSIKDSTCNSDHECTVTYNDGTNSVHVQISCQSNYKGEYTCPLQSDSEEWKKYIEKFQKVVDKDEDDIKKIRLANVNRIHYGDYDLAKKSVDFFKSWMVNKDDGDNKCIRNYFYRESLNSQVLHYSGILMMISFLLL